MKFRALTCVLASFGFYSAASVPATAGPNPYLGDIIMVGQNFCPRGWMETKGQLLPISQNSALFSLLGTMYGGDGRTTFGLPDLQGRVPVGLGRGAGLSNVGQGQKFGAEQTTLIVPNLPAHSHTASNTAKSSLNGSTGGPDSGDPLGSVLGTFPAANPVYATSGAPDQPFVDGGVTTSVTTNIGNTGNNLAFDRHQPSIGIKFCIATVGAYPPRS